MNGSWDSVLICLVSALKLVLRKGRWGGQQSVNGGGKLNALLDNEPPASQLSSALEAEKFAQLKDLAVVSLVHYSIHQRVGVACACQPCERLHALFTHNCDSLEKGPCASCRYGANVCSRAALLSTLGLLLVCHCGG